jgi:hypothetical protein
VYLHLGSGSAAINNLINSIPESFASIRAIRSCLSITRLHSARSSVVESRSRIELTMVDAIFENSESSLCSDWLIFWHRQVCQKKQSTMAPVRLVGASLVLLWGVVSGEKAESKKLRACPTETNIMTRDGGRIVIFSSVWLVCRCQLHHEFELNILLKVKRWGLHSQTNLVLMSMCFG